MYISYFTYLLMDIWVLSAFWLLFEHDCPWFQFFCIHILILQVQLLDHMVIFFNFLTLFSIAAALFYIPTSSALGHPFLHILTNTGYFLFFLSSFLPFIVAIILTDIKWYLSTGLISVSVMICDVEHLCMWLLALTSRMFKEL